MIAAKGHTNQGLRPPKRHAVQITGTCRILVVCPSAATSSLGSRPRTKDTAFAVNTEGASHRVSPPLTRVADSHFA
jgi:hypothetical protein